MSLYRKNETGQVRKTAGNLVQRFNDRIFLTTHSVENGEDFYDIELGAKKYILGLTDFTEFQLYIDEPNVSENINIRYMGKTLKLKRSDNDPIVIGFLSNRHTLYTLNTTDNTIYIDPLLQPTPDTYRGIFTYALQTWDPDMIPEPQIGETVVALNTNLTYEYDGTEWDLVGPIDDPATGTVTEPLNGWYWLIEFFPDYYFGNGKIVWNGTTNSWNIYTARVPRPDEITIKTDPNTNQFKIHSIPNELLNAEAISYDNETSELEADNVQAAIDELNDTKSDKIPDEVTIVTDPLTKQFKVVRVPERIIEILLSIDETYVKEINVSGITIDTNLTMYLDLSEVTNIDTANYQRLEFAKIYNVETDLNKIIFTAYDTVAPIKILLKGVF